MGVGRIFSIGAIVDCSRWGPTPFFQGRAKVMKFQFTSWRLREKHFYAKTLTGKNQISKFRGERPFFATPFQPTRSQERHSRINSQVFSLGQSSSISFVPQPIIASHYDQTTPIQNRK